MAPPVIYDTETTFASSITLSAGADLQPSLYYDLVLHGVSWANYSWGAYAPVSGSGGQEMVFVPWYDGHSSLEVLAGTQTTASAVSHQYNYAMANAITGVGLKFTPVPEPSGAILVAAAGVIGLLRRRRLM